MADLYSIALAAWNHETGEPHAAYATKLSAPNWRDSAHHLSVITKRFVEPREVILNAQGSGKIFVQGDVGNDAIIICSGGSAYIKIFGKIGEGAKILALGGGARVETFGDIAFSAKVRAIGGGACVVKGNRYDRTIGWGE